MSAYLNPKAKKTAYVLEIDFSETLWIKTSSAQITKNYSENKLIWKQILAVVNFAPKKIAGIKSEVLVLAVVCEKSGNILIEPNLPVKNGEKLA